jgi:hypothetical protein
MAGIRQLAPTSDIDSAGLWWCDCRSQPGQSLVTTQRGERDTDLRLECCAAERLRLGGLIDQAPVPFCPHLRHQLSVLGKADDPRNVTFHRDCATKVEQAPRLLSLGCVR